MPFQTDGDAVSEVTLTDGIVLLRASHATAAAVLAHGQDPDIVRTHWLPVFAPCTDGLARRLIDEFRRRAPRHRV